MKITEAMSTLKSAGTAQNRKIYARHGARAKAFGVSYADLGKLKRKIGVDPGLAEKLWASGNHDACVLATMVADPAGSGAAQLSAWARDLDSYILGDALAGLVARSPHARALAEKWTKSRTECISACGWSVLSRLIQADEKFTQKELRTHLRAIEKNIRSAPNRTRHSMNGALIAIGAQPGLTDEALASAERIGKVEVDHGETGCKTPDAASYIAKVLAHRSVLRKKA